MIACVVLGAVSCASRGSVKGVSGKEASVLPDSIVTMLRDCERFRNDVRERDKIILKLTADLERMGDVLESVQRQIATLDNGTAQTIRIVAVDRANIRRGPGMEYDVLARAELGALLFQIDADASWYRIKMIDGTAGWIHHSVTLAH